MGAKVLSLQRLVRLRPDVARDLERIARLLGMSAAGLVEFLVRDLVALAGLETGGQETAAPPRRRPANVLDMMAARVKRGDLTWMRQHAADCRRDAAMARCRAAAARRAAAAARERAMDALDAGRRFMASLAFRGVRNLTTSDDRHAA